MITYDQATHRVIIVYTLSTRGVDIAMGAEDLSSAILEKTTLPFFVDKWSRWYD